MSHFTVIVVGENIEEQLAPYEESSQDPRFRSFKSTEREDMAEYLTGTLKAVILPDGSKSHEYDADYRTFKPDSFESQYNFPEGSVHQEMKFSDYYSSFEDYKREWCGQEERDSETGEYGYWHNENSKWDWYSVGGRWSGYFKLKNGAEGTIGKPGVFGNEAKVGWVDSARIQDIDFGFMVDEAVTQAHATYDTLEGALKGRPLPSWKNVLAKHGDNIEAARAEYAVCPVKKDLEAAGLTMWFSDYEETFKSSRQEYVDACAAAVAVPFALVKDGVWYEKGEMGWFGMSHDEKDQQSWNEEFWKLIKSLPEETTLTLVDCHI